MSKYIILDLDNCIANDMWRIPAINWQWSNPTHRYHDYHSLAGFDEVGNEDLIWGHGKKILIFTARPVQYAAITHEWLRRKGIEAAEVIMRNNGDHRSSAELKQAMALWLPGNYGIQLDEIAHAYDDREDVVQMYRDMGIAASVRAIHNVCAYTNAEEPAA